MRTNSRSARTELLEKITQVDRRGTVDGVIFDLRHDLLDPKEWGTQTIGLDEDWSKVRTYGRPFIWFPWYGEFNAAAVLEKSMQKNDGHSKQLARIMRSRLAGVA
jgi:hypothetical protein